MRISKIKKCGYDDYTVDRYRKTKALFKLGNLSYE